MAATFPDAHAIVADLVEQLTDNGDLDHAREQPGYPTGLHTAAVGALYALRDQLAGTTPTPTLGCGCNDPYLAPIDVLEGTVEVASPPTHLDTDGTPVGYDPEGYTDVDFGTAQTVGTVCANCYRTTITRTTVTIAGHRYINIDLGR